MASNIVSQNEVKAAKEMARQKLEQAEFDEARAMVEVDIAKSALTMKELALQKAAAKTGYARTAWQEATAE